MYHHIDPLRMLLQVICLFPSIGTIDADSTEDGIVNRVNSNISKLLQKCVYK